VTAISLPKITLRLNRLNVEYTFSGGYAKNPYFRTADLLLELKLAKADGSFAKWKRQLATFSLLILDDWLRDPLSADQARDLLDLLDERYRKASCLFATQLPVPQWHQQIQEPLLLMPCSTALFMMPCV
jgi:DNA replication protein DnaC